MTLNNQMYGQKIGTAASINQYNNKRTRLGTVGMIAINIMQQGSIKLMKWDAIFDLQLSKLEEALTGM